MNPRFAAFPRKYLWQAPRGFFFKLTRNSDAMLKEMIAGRSVAVVGNAKSLLDTDFGPAIDAHDVIIRLNRGFVVQPTAQGSRTDLVGITPELTEDETANRFAPQAFVMLTPKMRHYAFKRPENIRRTIFYAYRFWLADRNRIGRRPSSGYMMISYLLRLNSAASITLYGFDFGATQTYYNPEGYRTPHDYAAERAIILDWAAQGRLTIVSA